MKPTKYKPIYCKQLIDWMASGGSYNAFASQVSVCRQTLLNWEAEFPEWKNAKAIAFEQGLAWWEQRGREGMMGQIKGFNASIWIFSIKNRFKNDYAESINVEEKNYEVGKRKSAIAEKKKELAAAYGYAKESSKKSNS